jgi:hypothetical protein
MDVQDSAIQSEGVFITYINNCYVIQRYNELKFIISLISKEGQVGAKRFVANLSPGVNTTKPSF